MVAHLNSLVSDPVRRQLRGFTAVEGHPRDNKSLPFARQFLSGRYYPRDEELPLASTMKQLGWKGET